MSTRRSCTAFVDRRPCDEPATIELRWEELVKEGYEIATARCYCDRHAALCQSVLEERGILPRRLLA